MRIALVAANFNEPFLWLAHRPREAAAKKTFMKRYRGLARRMGQPSHVGWEAMG